MLGSRGPGGYEIAVCGYTSDLGGKNLQSEWYAIKVPNPDPDPDPYQSAYLYQSPDEFVVSDEESPDEFVVSDEFFVPYEFAIAESLQLESSIENPSIGKKQVDLSPSAKEKEKVKINPPAKRKGKAIINPPSANKKGKVEINPFTAKANEKGTIETKPLRPFSVVRMVYQSTEHAFPLVRDEPLTSAFPLLWAESLASASPHLDDEPFAPVSLHLGYERFASASPHPGDELVASSYRPGCTHLFSLGGLDPVGSNSDGDGVLPFESERCLKVWSLEVNKPDAGWKAVPLMTFPNRYNPQSVVQNGKLYVFGGFSRSQFPAEAAAKGVGWMEAYDSFEGWKPLPNPPSGFSFNVDPLIFTALDDEMKVLLAQYNHDDMTCDSATFYVYDVLNKLWRILDPPVRTLLARYPDRTGRRCVAVGYTLYWGLFEDEDINVQAYDLNKNIWFHGSFNIRPVLGKDEFLADNVFPASPPLLHLANQKFCLFLLTSIYDEKNCEAPNLYLNCLILDVSPINDEGDNHQHDYYDHVCYEVRDDVNVDDKEDNANYHVHHHGHFWRLSISIVSIQKYPLVYPIQLWDAGVLRRPWFYPPLRSMSGLKLKSV